MLVTKGLPLIIVSLLVTAFSVQAHNKVVVIPMAGDDLKPLQNIVSVAKKNGDFSDPIAALDSITNASASNPYLVVIAPGTYDLGNETLILKPYVYVQGSGKDITTIKSATTVDRSSTVRLVNNSSIADVTVRNESNTGGALIAALAASGLDFLVRNCKLHATNPALRGEGFVVTGQSGETAKGLLDSVEFIVAGNIDTGVGGFSWPAADENSFIHINDSHFTVLSTGKAIAALEVRSDSTLLVTNTVIDLQGAGIGVESTDADTQIYRNVVIRSDAVGATAFDGRGSGFRPDIESSHIELTGTDSVAISTNNGRPKIRNSYIRAETGFMGTSQQTTTAQFFIDNSIIEGTNAVSIDDVGGSTNIDFGASQLDVINNVNEINGTINATCVNSYDENYTALSSTCN